MKEELLLNRYAAIEAKTEPIRLFLHENLENTNYKGLYNGFMPLQGPIVYQPEILFLGFNPGPGAYYEAKGRNKDAPPPVRMLEKEDKPLTQVDLEWYRPGVAYGRFRNPKEKKGWESYKWYQTDRPINNDFPVRMLRLLNEVAKLKYPSEKTIPTELPSWYDTLGQSIISYNLYPIATKNIGDLTKIHTALSREKSLQTYWEQSKGNEKRINNWVVRKYFIRLVEDLVDLTQPKIIVCLGVDTFNNFCSVKRNRHSNLFKEKTINNHTYPVLGLDRSGNWTGRIPQLAQQIIEKQKIK